MSFFLRKCRAPDRNIPLYPTELEEQITKFNYHTTIKRKTKKKKETGVFLIPISTGQKASPIHIPIGYNNTEIHSQYMLNK